MKELILTSTNTSEILSKVLRYSGPEPLNVHFINTYSLGLMYRKESYRNSLSDAYICLPDGWPVLLLMRMKSKKARKATQIRGVSLMRLVLNAKDELPIKHFLIGSSEENLKELITTIGRQYPNAQIAGSYSPPYQSQLDWISEKSQDFLKSNADFVWVGLGTPKQDMLLKQLSQSFPNAKALFAVGAAFDFLTKNRREASKLVVALKLEWLHRLIQEPKRLWKRYTIYALYFLISSKFVEVDDLY